MNEMGKFIAEIRKEKNMTQKDLAKVLYVSDRAVSKWERGKSFPDISLLKKISEVLDVSLTELFNGKRMDEVSIEKTDKILEDSVKHLKKQSYKNILIKVLLIIPIILFFFFVFLIVVSEFYYGSIRIGNKTLDFPNLSSSVAKVYSDKFMEAFKNEDFDKIAHLYRSFEVDEKIMESFQIFYEYYDVVDYEYNYFFHNGSNYTIAYNVVLQVLEEEVDVIFYIVSLNQDVIFSPNIYDFIDEDIIKNCKKIEDAYFNLVSLSFVNRV